MLLAVQMPQLWRPLCGQMRAAGIYIFGSMGEVCVKLSYSNEFPNKST